MDLMSPLPDVAFWLLVLALVAAVVAALRYRRVAGRRAARVGALEAAVRMRDDEARHLVERRLPALSDGLRQGRQADVPGPLHGQLSGTQFADDQERVLGMVAAAEENAEQTARGLLLDVARKLQGLANNQQVKITEMTARHDDPEFLQDLMDVDHTNAQILRRAVGMAVICRSWPGRQHDATSLHDVVRGAVGRILDYQRVQIVRIEDSRAVQGRAVEALVVALAELLENATRSSHPNTPVQVHVQLTHGGLAVVIEDAGVGLNTAERAKATRLLNDAALGVAGLGSPARFGLAACGALARRYGFSVSVDSASAFGGVRAVVNIPGTLLTDAPATAPVAALAPQPVAVATPAAPATTAGGLPKRTRKRQPAPAETAGRAATPARRSPGEAAAPLGAFQRASQAAAQQRRAHPDRTHTEGTPQP
ncbi:ATP-binding protein [Streptomyces sp. NPDC048650]|uniref:ATP-binding protein n=1 Tax=unclassified Streptomyces TaxID=2593676 RepID=UPI00372166FB